MARPPGPPGPLVLQEPRDLIADRHGRRGNLGLAAVFGLDRRDVGDHRRVGDELLRGPRQGQCVLQALLGPGLLQRIGRRKAPAPPDEDADADAPVDARRELVGPAVLDEDALARRWTVRTSANVAPRRLAKSQMYRARSSMGLFSITVAGGTRCPAASAAGSVDYRYLPGAGFGGGFSNSHRATSGAPGSTFSRRSCIWRRLLTLKTSVNVSACDGSVNFIRRTSARQ